MNLNHDAFEFPKAHVILFDNEDVITASPVPGESEIPGGAVDATDNLNPDQPKIPGADFGNEW